MADLAIQITNNASGQLDAGITAAATTLTLKVGEGAEFPSTAGSNYFYTTLQKSDGNWEIVKVTTRTGDVFNVIVRNQDSSTGSAQAFSANDIVSLRPCAQVIEDIIAEIISHQIQLYAPVGTEMYFYQNTSPAGWTINAAIVDVLLSVKGGSDAYDANGGTQVGDWDQGNHTHTGPSHTHTTPDHQLTENEMPSHTHVNESAGNHNHDISKGVGSAEEGAIVISLEFSTITLDKAGHIETAGAHQHTNTPTGGDAVHNHGATGGDGTGASGGSKTPISWRPDAANGIIATKD